MLEQYPGQGTEFYSELIQLHKNPHPQSASFRKYGMHINVLLKWQMRFTTKSEWSLERQERWLRRFKSSSMLSRVYW